jgi:transposase
VSAPAIPSAPADLELIAQLKNKLQYAELRIRLLEERLRLLRIEKYGAGGEKLSKAQMQLFELEPVISEMTEQAENEHAPAHRSTKKSAKHPGRQELPSNLPRIERVLPCTPDQRLCKRCDRETVVIGYEESSQLDVEPAKYFVLVTKREKRACRSCEELGVVSAPLPPRIIEKCLASDRIVIDTVVSKYCNHTPLHRQSVILERDLGLKISRATLDGWVLKVGELLIPMVAAMRRELISGTYIQADETPVDVQTREGRGQNHQAYLWQYSRPGGTTVFDFRLGRGRDGPKRFLGQFEGILQTDGYSAYDQIGGPGMVHAACWAHARRHRRELSQFPGAGYGAPQ